MADLNMYDVDLGGFQTQMKLTEEDAEQIYGDRASKVGSLDTVEAVPVFHGNVPDTDESGEKKAPAPANKSRSASNKS